MHLPERWAEMPEVSRPKTLVCVAVRALNEPKAGLLY